ncbi:MAG TPA: TetR/AcrR family transcriptional regulator, partial [Steroidobacteraceae bacterium]|nr:TetR/AcrR family transcriptional regulator [Steroidobacteraceae bacterium]
MRVRTASPPRHSTRDQLLAKGREIVLRSGFQGLTVREVAAAAGANLGSFVYHFGTRERFLRELIEEWYAPLMSRITDVAGGEGRPLERLRGGILQLVEYGRAQHGFLGRLLMAAAAGEPAVREFASTLFGRHPLVLVGLIAEAQADGSIVREQPLQVLMFLLGSAGLPLLLANAWHGPPLFDKSTSAALARFACDPGP